MAYTKINKAHSNHSQTLLGEPASRYSRYETGLIGGHHRNIPAIIADSAGFDGMGFDASIGSSDDNWYLVNTFKDGGQYVDTIAIGGAMDADHAMQVISSQLDSIGPYSVKLVENTGSAQFDSLSSSNDGWSIDAINKLMSNPSQDKSFTPIITASELETESSRVTFDSVQWGGEHLTSHGGNDSSLYLDMVRADSRHELINALDLSDELQVLGAKEESFDSLMETKSRLGLLKDRLYNAMSRAGNDSLSVTNVTETKPFKRGGVSNIAFIFDLSDGQKVSIWFHNPDSTPTKLLPSDIMISWKWMLNKRDVTAVLSPKHGDNVQLPMLASRILRVAAKNSTRFKTAQARKIQVEQELADAQSQLLEKTAIAEQLDVDISDLNKKIEAVMSAPPIEDTPSKAVDIGRNSSKEVIYENADGSRYVAARGGHSIQESSDGEREVRFLTEEENKALNPSANAYLFDDDINVLTNDELDTLYKAVDIAAKKADVWNKNMNALQNEGGEGFDFGGEEALKLSTRRGDIKQEIDRRQGNNTFTPKFMLEIMRTYWGKLLFVDESYDMSDVAKSLGVDYFTTKRMISAARASDATKDAMGAEAAKQIEFYKNNAAGKPAYPEIIAAILASMGGYKPSDNKELLDIANKIISGEVQAIDVVPEVKKKYFTVTNPDNDNTPAAIGTATDDGDKKSITLINELKSRSNFWIKDALKNFKGNDIWNQSAGFIGNLSNDDFNKISDALNQEGSKGEDALFRAKRTDDKKLISEAMKILRMGMLSPRMKTDEVIEEMETRRNILLEKINNYFANAYDKSLRQSIRDTSPIATDVTDEPADSDNNTITAKTPNKKITTGKAGKAKTAKGTKIESTYALVDAKFLIASHTASGAKNPKYPQELQPRDRARESSIAWVQKTSRSLDPESLGRTSRVDTGAPIVGKDLIVESGNGRTIAIKMAYTNGDAGEYREWLSENADMFGMTAQQVAKYKEPILVRVRDTDIDRVAFSVEANQDDKLSFTASERAKSDANRITDGMLDSFNPSESGDLLAASNQGFVRSFLLSIGETEAAQYTDSNGQPTQSLVARMKSAVFSKAYDDDRLLEMMADQTKPDLQNMLNALSMAAPNFVEARAANRSQTQDIAESMVDAIEQTLDDKVQSVIVDAGNIITRAKANNQDIKEYVTQLGLFENIEPSTIELALFLAANARSAKKMAEYFKAMATYVESVNKSNQNLDIFGEPEPVSLSDVIAHAAQATLEPESKQTDIFNTDPEPIDASNPDLTSSNSNQDGIIKKLDEMQALAEDESVDLTNDFTNDFIDELTQIEADNTDNDVIAQKIETVAAAYEKNLTKTALKTMQDMLGQP